MGNFEPLQIKHFLVVDVGGKNFAFDITEIESIHTSKNVVSNDGIEDMKASVRLHKKVVPIINLRQKFVLKTSTSQPFYPSIIYMKNKTHGETTIIGVQVDMIVEVVEVNQLQIKTHEYGFSVIQNFTSDKFDPIPLIRMKDIVIEHESSMMVSEILN